MHGRSHGGRDPRPRAGAALTALVALLLATPVVLGWCTVALLPPGGPIWSPALAALAHPGDGTVFLAAALAASWLAWGALTGCIAVEVLAQLRQRPTPRLRGLGWGQHAAATLVSTAMAPHSVDLILLPPMPVPEFALASAVSGTDAADQNVRPAAGAEEPLPRRRTYTTQRHDTYFSIARDQLGDRDRYRELIDCNTGRRMPDGTVLTGDEFLEPGWELLLPDPFSEYSEYAAHLAAPVAEPAPQAAAPQLVGAAAAGRDRAPGVATDLTAHDRQPAVPQPRRGQAPTVMTAAPPRPGGGSPEPASTPEPTGVAAAATVDDLGAGPAAEQPGAGAAGPAVSAEPAAPDAAGDDDSESRFDLLDRALRSMAAQAADTGAETPRLLGARLTERGCELLLAAATEEGIAPFRSTGHYAWLLDRDNAALLAAPEAATIPAPYPALVTVGCDTTGAHVLVDLTEAGALNLTGTSGHARDVLTAMALELTTSEWGDRLTVTTVGFGAEVPTLEPTGRLRHSATLRDCLDQLSVAARASQRHHRHAATGAQEQAPHLILSAHPFGEGDMLRLREAMLAAPDVPLAIVARAEEHQHRFPTDWTLDTTPGAKVHLPALGRTVTLGRLTADRHAHVAAVLAGLTQPSSAPAREREDEPWERGAEATPRGGSRTDEALTELLAVPAQAGREWPESGHRATATSATAPAPRPGAVSSEPAPSTAAAPGDPAAGPRIRVLGPVDITGVDTRELEAGKRRGLVELACLLKLAPGQTPDDLSRAMGGANGPWSASTRSASLSRLRSWLGRDAEGNAYFPKRGSDGTYALAGTVGCDWYDFQALARFGMDDDTPEGTAALRQALDLVRGEPFTSASPDRYAWAGPLRPTILGAIAEVAHTLAARQMAAGEMAAARDVLTTILRIDPANELLYRDLFRVEHRAGAPEAVNRAAQRLVSALDQAGREMSAETRALLNQLDE
ncbi:BTAD domain-containing putative transcriptional regulator [Salinactinospora qingdaonensis]|uniref:BTAD domain-containing putative transcriptional regulator n=1 Tax=Salinactinospora qingdaonensis TaxID=702744 RepID=A0ABP7F8W8_9ACTN